MKLNINKACDLSSISVVPPRSKGMSSGADGSGLGRSQGSQLRSQSQQSFSQGPSLSQLSGRVCDDRSGKESYLMAEAREENYENHQESKEEKEKTHESYTCNLKL
uniref:Protein PAIR1-like isoform X2 n=1 Tax=Elaeis guineensis var. tenera TaxID=51953 RepID=A0A6I9QDP7_ELAGV|nr:protein PAIR1-like isoform X2 [Elaeis guineensis]